MRSLILNVSYEPLGIIPWEKAFSLVYTGKAELVEEYDRKVHSSSMAFSMPAVIRLRKYINRRWMVKFGRKAVYMRDKYTCAYCGEVFISQDLTFDHVTPRSRGGQTTWENIATACRKCNEKKGNQTPREAGMALRIRPRCPHRIPHLMSRMKIEETPEEWKTYLWAPR